MVFRPKKHFKWNLISLHCVAVVWQKSPPSTLRNVASMSFMAFHFMLDLSHMNDKDKQQVCNDISTSLWDHFWDTTNADLLLDSVFKLSDIIVNLCSKLLDYILLKSASISGLYFT